jgi:hypothetical protein
MPRLHAAAARDQTLAASLIRVIALKDRPEGLLRPDRMLRVLRGNLRLTRTCLRAAGLPDPQVHIRQIPDMARHHETGKAVRPMRTAASGHRPGGDELQEQPCWPS